MDDNWQEEDLDGVQVYAYEPEDLDQDAPDEVVCFEEEDSDLEDEKETWWLEIQWKTCFRTHRKKASGCEMHHNERNK